MTPKERASIEKSFHILHKKLAELEEKLDGFHHYSHVDREFKKLEERLDKLEDIGKMVQAREVQLKTLHDEIDKLHLQGVQLDFFEKSTKTVISALGDRLDKLQRKYDRRILTQQKFVDAVGETLSPKVDELTTVMRNLYSFLSKDPRVPQ